MELLEPAYASITGFHLDGSPFEKSRSVARQTRRKYTLYVHAVLHGFLASKDGAVSLYSDKQDENPHYVCNAGLSKDGWELKNRIGLMKQRKVWAVSCQHLDRIILDRLFDLVRHDSDMVERIKAFWESRKTEEVDEAHVLRQQIKKAEDQIARLDKLLTEPARPLSKASEERYLTTLAEVEEDLARLKKQQAARQAIEDPQSIIPNFYYVLSYLPTEYQKLSAEGQKKLMRIVAKEVKLDMVSPHLFQLSIIWENGIAVRPDVALVWRGVTPNTAEDWSEEEDTIMRRRYANQPQIELMKALPHRAWYRICDRAQVLNVRRSLPQQGRVRTNEYHRTMRYDDLEAVAQFGQSQQEKERLCQIANELAERTKRGSLSAYWWLPLAGIGYSGRDDDAVSEVGAADLFNLSAFPCEVRHPDG